jgi:L-ascorbate metabolism protein UlaG (beta-lactamase superfamily)
MRITRYGHSCLLVEDGGARLLLDPGVFSQGFEDLRGLTGVLVTHQHADHLDPGRLRPLLEANPEAVLHCDSGSVEQLGDLPHTVVAEGDVLDLGARVRVVGAQHAVIHEDIPRIPNVGYLVSERFFTPGDAMTVPDADVELLGLPTAAPWLKQSEAVQLLRSVRPAQAFPVHDAVLSAAGLGVWYGQFERLAPAGTAFRRVAPGESV